MDSYTLLRRFWTIWACALSTIALSGQSLDSVQSLYEAGRLYEALEVLDTITEMDHTDRFWKAKIYQDLGDIQESINYSHQIVQDSLVVPDRLLLHARNLHRAHQFLPATNYYREFLELDSVLSYYDRQEIVQELTRCLQGLNQKAAPMADWHPVSNLAQYNTSESIVQVFPLDFANIDFFFVLDSGSVSQSHYALSNYPEGGMSTLPVYPDSRGYSSPVGIRNKEMYFIVETRVGPEVVNLSGNQKTDYWASLRLEKNDRIVALEDSMLVISSRRRGGKGGYDLYLSEWSLGGWTTPKNMGEPINSPFDELTLSFSTDQSKIYFSSDRTLSMGGLDIFEAQWVDSIATWSDVKNMGYPVNTASDELSIDFYPHGEMALVVSNRPGGQGRFDVHRFVANQKDSIYVHWSESVIEVDIEEIERQNFVPIDTPELYIAPLIFEDLSALNAVQNLQQIQDIGDYFAQDSLAMLTVHVFVHPDTSTLSALRYGAVVADSLRKIMLGAGIDSLRTQFYSFGASRPVAMYQDSLQNALFLDSLKENQHIRMYLETPEVVRLYYKDIKVPDLVAQTEYSELSSVFMDTLSYKMYIGHDTLINAYESLLDSFDVQVVSLEDGAWKYYVGEDIDYRRTRATVDKYQELGYEHVYSEAFYRGRRITEKRLTRLAIPYPQLRFYLGDLLMR